MSNRDWTARETFALLNYFKLNKNFNCKDYLLQFRVSGRSPQFYSPNNCKQRLKTIIAEGDIETITQNYKSKYFLIWNLF
jgi:hypothetical protein